MQSANDDPRSDHELIASVNRGDVEAFGALYRRHRDWVVHLAFRFTGDHSLALDVLQETFLYFLKKFPGFTLNCQLRSFLYPAVRHVAIAARRKAERCQSGDPAAIAQLAAPPHGTTSDSGREQLAGVVAALPSLHCEVLLLRFVDGLSLQEIAEALGIPLGTVKSRLHYALEVLRRDQWAKKYFES